MHTLRCVLMAAALAPAALAAQQTVPLPEGAPPAHGTAAITAADVAARLAFLAGDALLGRNTPSPGLEAAARYAAAELARFGLQPAGDSGTFIQRYPYAATSIDRGAVAFRAGSTALVYGQDYLLMPGGVDSLSGKPLYVGTARAGMIMPRPLAGRIIMVALPGTFDLSGDSGWQSNLEGAVVAAMNAGAAAVVVVLDPAFGREAVAMLTPAVAQGNAPLPVYAVMHGALAPVLAAAGEDLARLRAAEPAQPLELPVDLLLRAGARRAQSSVPNVVAVLPGSDPVLRHEYVVFSAHMDHVGVGHPDADGDSIFNGADDDASGTTGVLEVAQAFAAGPRPPARSLVFLLVSGEEKGLLGSRYFAEHPTVPAEGIVASLNADMIGHSRPDTVFVIGQDYSDLGAAAERLAERHRTELGLVIAPDLWPDENLFRRSDHYSFVARGIPSVFFFTGLHPIYHTPADGPETIDNEKLARVARLMYLLGEDVANAAARPQWTDAGRALLKSQ